MLFQITVVVGVWAVFGALIGLGRMMREQLRLHRVMCERSKLMYEMQREYMVRLGLAREIINDEEDEEGGMPTRPEREDYGYTFDPPEEWSPDSDQL